MRASVAKRVLGCVVIACGWLSSEGAAVRAQGKPRKPASAAGVASGASASAIAPGTPGTAASKELPPQNILPPGLYLYQTRTRDGSCNDAPRTGYVTSAIATLDGVPGSRTMTMQLLNSKYWPTWTLSVTAEDVIIGTAILNGGKDESAGVSRFEIRERRDRGRYQGVGARNYNATIDGKPTRCTLNYDALLKPIE